MAAAAVLGMSCLAWGAPAAAATKGTLFGFGDSLLDLKNVCPLIYPANSYGACGNGRGLLQSLPSHAPFTFDLANDYAAGGAGTGSFNIASVVTPRAIGTLDQIQAFAAAGSRIGARDLTIVTGRNNFYQIVLGQQTNGAALATKALADVDREVGTLVSAGARDMIYFDTRSPTAPDTAQVNAYETAFSAGLRGTLAAHGSQGVRIRIFNFTGLTAAVVANPTRYGFATGLSCAADPGCTTAATSVQDGHFLFDQHPTEAGYDLMARYIANLEASADAIAAQATVAAHATDAFSDALLGRASLAAMGRERGFFIEGGYDRDRRDTSIGDGGAALGYRDHVGRLVAGVAVPLAAGITAGAAFGYAHSSADVDGGGHIGGRSYQGGAFAGWRRAGAFADATVGYAHHDLSVDRPGVIDDLTADPKASTLFAQARAGYLFGFSGLRIGPVVRLAYDRTHVKSYGEDGDALLAQTVGGTTDRSVLGRAGARVESGAASPVSVFVEGDLAREFEGGRRVLTTSNVYAPDLPIETIVPGRYTDRLFGEVNAGLSAPIASRVRLLVQGSSSFARRGGDDYAVQAGIHVGI